MLKKRIKEGILFTTIFSLVVTGAFHGTKESGQAQAIDVSEYCNNEVYVQYTDSTSEVIQYESTKALEQGIIELESQEDVKSVQPNYEYISTGTMISDAYYSEQWAMNNDGTFSPSSDSSSSSSEDTGSFPIYDNPFGDPQSHDNYWNGVKQKSISASLSAGLSYSAALEAYSTQTTAVSGIDINAEEAWAEYNGGVRETIVAVIDTGIDYTNEDLADNIWVNEDEIAGDGIDNDGNGYIDDVYGWNFYSDSNQVYVGSEDSHGTHCAGTIAASQNTVGIAGICGSSSNVKVMIVKALGGSEGSGTTQSVIDAIKYAEANGAVICNLSFGTTTDDSALEEAIAESSMLFVAAAGNGSGTSSTGTDNDETPIYPASYDLDNIISVANISYNGELHYSSNYGSTSVDLAAPGTYILSTSTSGDYAYMTGTSMAAPMVTGVAAMIYSQYSDVTVSQVRQMILNSTTTVSALSGKVATGGMLNAYAALTYDYSQLESTDTSSDSDDDSSSVEETSGSAPVIKTTVKVKNGVKYLKINVVDEDGDLATVCYGSGKLKASAFNSGSSYTKITLNSNNNKWLKIKKSGTITIYAVDDEGNETTKTVSYTK